MKNITFDINKYNKQIAILPLELLEVADYQRPVSQGQVNKIVKSYDPRGIGTLMVSKRGNRYWIFDGQHRHQALKSLGARTVDCIVYSGMSYEDEAKAFEYFNTTKKAGPLELANAALQRKETQAVAIDNVVNSVGLAVDYDKSNTYGKIVAYKALEYVYKKYGADHLRESLLMIKEAFGTSGSYIFSSDNIRGFADFLNKYSDNQNYKEGVLVKWLRKMDISEFKFETDKIKKLWNKRSGEAVVANLLDVHNSHRNHGNRIS